MGWFGFGKKEEDIVDLSAKYKRQQERAQQQASVQQQRPHTYFESLVENAKKQNIEKQAVQINSPPENTSEEAEEKKQKLGRRLVEIEIKLDNISNQIYHLQQRVELLEKKTGVKIEAYIILLMLIS